MQTKNNSLLQRPHLAIAGPCSAESREQLLETATLLAQSGRVDILRAGVWKPRTNPNTFEGVGDIALDWLCEARSLTGLPVATEVATTAHVEKALRAGIDVVWIGARTTTNPFSTQEVAEALRGSKVAVLVKNPTTPDIGLWMGAVERLNRCGIDDVGLIHRGFSLHNSTDNYRNTPLWQVALEAKERMPQLPMICDPSHICGNRHALRQVAQQAADLNYSGLMIECHPRPDEALSDKEQQITPNEAVELLGSIIWRNVATDSLRCNEELEQLRASIDRLDGEIFALIAQRMNVAEEIGRLKRVNNLTILQSGRWQEVVERVTNEAAQHGLSREFTSRILEAIHIESIERQNKIMQ